MEEIFLGVMGLQEAKNHQYHLKSRGVELVLKVNDQTCTTGCKVTVEVWGSESDKETIFQYLQNDFQKHVKGHEVNLEHLTAVYDTSALEVICQACGMKFAPTLNECPDCGLVY